MSLRKSSLITLLLGIFISLQVLAGTCENHSTPTRAVLIELFTSEGCSSCPVADRWMSKLVHGVFPSSQVVTLAFHVDYWDHLGWRDTFGDKAYSARQFAYTKMSGSSFAFTPQVLLGGHNYNQWASDSRFSQDVRYALGTLPAANFTLLQQMPEQGGVAFEVQAQLKQGLNLNEVRVYAALFQNGIESDVLNGENGGNRLHHDFVVRGFVTSQAMDSNGHISMRDNFKMPTGVRSDQLGIAVFAQDRKTGAVLQAMSAPLCPNRINM